MYNLYSMTCNVDAIRRLFKVDPLHDRTGNLPPMPGIYPDYPAPIVKNGYEGTRACDAALGHAVVAKSLDGRHQRRNSAAGNACGGPVVVAQSFRLSR